MYADSQVPLSAARALPNFKSHDLIRRTFTDDRKWNERPNGESLKALLMVRMETGWKPILVLVRRRGNGFTA